VSGAYQSPSELLIPLTSVFTQVHDTILYLWDGAVIWCIPGLLLGKRFPQRTRNSPPTYIYLCRRLTSMGMSPVTSAGSVQCRHFYYLLEVYPRGSCSMKGWCLCSFGHILCVNISEQILPPLHRSRLAHIPVLVSSDT
jgi:hypothetical protein